MPTGSTAIAISAAASANAAAAASIARKAECRQVINQLEGKKLTVEERQVYADCVREVYPREMDQHDVMAVKALIVIGLVGFIFGGFLGYREDGFALGVALAFLTAAGAVVGALMLVGIAYAILFLFS